MVAATRLVFVAAGDPNDSRTNSGVASNLVSALSAHLAIARAVSSLPSKRTMALLKARSFAPTKSAWRSRWRLSSGQVHAASDAIRRGLADAGDFDALLQIGTYGSVEEFVSKPTFTYIDHDLPALVRLDPRMHGTSPDARYVRRRIDQEKRILTACARVFTFSEWCRECVLADYGFSQEKVVAVGAGSNIDEHLLKREPDYEAQHAVMLGFDFERKGGRAVLAAFAATRVRLPGARLTIIGGLPVGEVQPGVTSTGALRGPDAKARIASIFASASLYVMPSLFEPFGIAFLEAMAAGLACIGSNGCAMPEIIDDCGSIVEADDAASLSGILVDLLSNPEALRRLGERARLRYRERYGWSRVAKRMAASICETISPSS